MGLTKKQNEALRAMLAGQNVFLSGDAGTGKSFVLNEYLKQTNRRVVVCAPTGIAAINVEGATLHRVFKVPIGPISPTKEPKKPSEVIKDADTILIDEISMCRFDVFEYVAKVIRKAEKRGKEKQVIVVGDFFQLPPVITTKDKAVLESYWGAENVKDGFAFQSAMWDSFNFQTIILDEVIRQQGEMDFIESLNAVRKGETTALAWFRENHSKEKQNGICICPTNKMAEDINVLEINKIDAEPKLYHAVIEGTVTAGDKPTEDILIMKPGMRVMSLANDQDFRYQNGSLGTVLKLRENSVFVQFDNGKKVELFPHEWKVYDYTIDDNGQVKKMKIGSFEQLPLKPAYAITIHKAQGQTYEKVNVIPSCFAAGQLYVALSRCTSIEGMHITEDIKPRYLRTSPEVLRFYEENGEKEACCTAPIKTTTIEVPVSAIPEIEKLLNSRVWT